MNEETPLEASLRAITAIEQTLRDCTQGTDNSGARRRINDAIRTIKHHFWWFGPANEKMANISAMGDALFRPRKHLSYGGVDKVRSFVLADCSVLRSIIGRATSAQGRDGKPGV